MLRDYYWLCAHKLYLVVSGKHMGCQGGTLVSLVQGKCFTYCAIISAPIFFLFPWTAIKILQRGVQNEAYFWNAGMCDQSTFKIGFREGLFFWLLKHGLLISKFLTGGALVKEWTRSLGVFPLKAQSHGTTDPSLCYHWILITFWGLFSNIYSGNLFFNTILF